MNKTLKTVLITLAAVFVVLFAVVMIFGEDTSASSGSASDIEENSLLESNISQSDEGDAQISIVSEISQEEYEAAIAYDVFDWNIADDQGKIKIAENIMRIWDAKGSVYGMTAEDLVVYINQNLSDQANIFEIACIAVQIDPQPYFDNIA